MLGVYRDFLGEMTARGARQWYLFVALILLVCVAVRANCAPDEPWPQYANIAPLPGGGIAINAEGRPDGLGAFHINIPVAYTPGWGFVSAGAYAGDYSNEKDEDFGNGSGILAIGFGNNPKLYASAMQVSRLTDEAKAVSAQLQIASEKLQVPAVAFGVQDILEKEEDMRSYYGTATKSFHVGDRPVYATLGYGTGRFVKEFFGGVSVPLSESLNFAAEWDGFQFNTGFAWRPGGRYGNVTFLAGYNEKADWLVGVGFAKVFGSSE